MKVVIPKICADLTFLISNEMSSNDALVFLNRATTLSH